MKNWFAPIFISAVFLTADLSAAESPMTISVDVKNPGAAIAPDFSGLSFEVSILLPNENGVRYFRPDNLPLLNLFRTLGIKNLLIGGNTSDRDVRKLPAEADLDSLFLFANRRLAPVENFCESDGMRLTRAKRISALACDSISFHATALAQANLGGMGLSYYPMK